METVLYLVEAALVAALGAWMAVAVADNWLFPEMNEEEVGTVMRLDLMAREYPEQYRLVAHRRVDSPRAIRLLFRAMRLAETLAALGLLASAALLVLAALGAVAGALATGAAILATTGFILIWAGFVIGGNYFVYWFCHSGSQAKHLMFMFWGFCVLIVLLLGV